jgi:hypothetical protein
MHRPVHPRLLRRGRRIVADHLLACIYQYICREVIDLVSPEQVYFLWAVPCIEQLDAVHVFFSDHFLPCFFSIYVFNTDAYKHEVRIG